MTTSARLTFSLALTQVLWFAGCGRAEPSAAGQRLSREEHEALVASLVPHSESGLAQGKQATLNRLLGRWQRTIAEDTVFGDDGALLCDGPGPLDLTGSYRLLDDKRISIAWPGAQHNTYSMAFIGDTLRLTLEGSAIGDGWTLTRRQ